MFSQGFAFYRLFLFPGEPSGLLFFFGLSVFGSFQGVCLTCCFLMF